MMLHELTIEGIATFEQQTLHMPMGMIAIAGEPGAGKSLLIEAVDWVFGANVSAKDVLRTGRERGRVGVIAHINHHYDEQLWHLLEEEDIELERQGKLSTAALEMGREFTETGSRFRINGVSVSRKFMQELRPYFVDIQSQHGTVALIQSTQQQAHADTFGGTPLAEDLNTVQQAFQQWKEAHSTLEQFEHQQADTEKRLHLLRLEVNELDTLNITQADEDEQLEAELARLTHAERLKTAYAESQNLLLGQELEGLEGGQNMIDGLSLMRRSLSHIEEVEPRVSPLLEQLESVREQLRDVSLQLDVLDGDVELNPLRVDEVQVRLSELQKMKRLYGPSLVDVMRHHEAASHELADLEFRSSNPKALYERTGALATELKHACDVLTLQRQRVAETLQARVNKTLEALAMPHARFEIALEPCEPTATGQERVQFMFTANPGEPLRPLGKVASGGELSRVLLALSVASLPECQTAMSKLYAFDEIDTGTSGEAAKTIGQQLQRLAEAGHQVLVVTHQAIVAAAAHHHFWVQKGVSQGQSHSSVLHYHTEADVEQLLTHLASGERLSTEATAPPEAKAFAQRLRHSMRPTAPL
jgi:DNA repair protein RecN (Recombination protein N)